MSIRSVAKAAFNSFQDPMGVDGWVQSLLSDALGKLSPEDEIVEKALGIIADSDEKDSKDDILQRLREQVTIFDEWTWLMSDRNNLDYMGRAGEAGLTDGDTMLAYAAAEFCYDVCYGLLQAIIRLSAEQDEEEDWEEDEE